MSNQEPRDIESHCEVRAKDGSLLFTDYQPFSTVKEAIEKAVERGTSLKGANLRKVKLHRAKLRKANLSEADLREADLREADLSEADLSGADLSGADLHCTNLQRANLCGANLQCANLQESKLSRANLRASSLLMANLRKADLQRADLQDAILLGANLQKTDLRWAELNRTRGMNEINKFAITPLLFLREQVGVLRAYKLVDENSKGPFYPREPYEVGKDYSVYNYDTDEFNDCGAGIHLCTLDWCIQHFEKGFRVLVAEFHPKDIVAIPIGYEGKFRVKKCKIVGEKDLAEIGLESLES